MGVSEWLSLIMLGIKIFLVFVEKMSKTPSEKRRTALAELDLAIEHAMNKKDLTDLSKWLGRKI